MIVELIVRAIAGLLSVVASLLGDSPAPGWLSSISSGLSSFASLMAPAGNWLPLSTMAAVGGAVLAAYGLSLGIKVARIIISLLTGGGGSAG